MNEQALALQEYIQRKHLAQLIEARQMDDASAGKVVTVCSGKGGVGKSTLSLNLGLATPKHTLLVDGDFLLGNLMTLTNHRAKGTWEEILTRRAHWENTLQPINATTDILAGHPLASEGQLRVQASAAVLSDLVRQWKQAYELILIDTAAGLGMRVIEWSLVADYVMIVTTPDPTSCANAYALIKALYMSQEVRTLGFVVNQYRQDEDPRMVFKQLEVMVQNVLEQPLYYWGAIPWIQEIALSARTQAPLLLQEAGREWRTLFLDILAALGFEKPDAINSFQIIG